MILAPTNALGYVGQTLCQMCITCAVCATADKLPNSVKRMLRCTWAPSRPSSLAHETA